MIVGSARFFHTTPWDVIIRRYRQKRGNIQFPTVQACIDDFFSYMLTEKIFFPEEIQRNYLRICLNLSGMKFVRVPDIPNINKKE